MKAFFHAGGTPGWAAALGLRAWCLAPVAGKPLLEYWLEWAADLRAEEVRLIPGDGADEVESFAGDGSRWGLRIEYGFLKDGVRPEAFLRRAPDRWTDGLLFIAGPVFPRRVDAPPAAAPDVDTRWLAGVDGAPCCLLSRRPADIRALVDGAPLPAGAAWPAIGLAPFVIGDVKTYYDLNLRLVGGEIARYVPPGYSGRENAHIGYNVQIPPSADLRPPLCIGNDCRIHPMAVVGPRVSIGNGVIIDRQTELSDAVVLDDTYVGRNLEIRGKIVSGSRVVSPEDGEVVELADPWLLAQLGTRLRPGDALRAAAGWAAAAALLLLQALPFALLYAAARAAGAGRFAGSRRTGRGGRPLRVLFWDSAGRPSRWERAFLGLGLDLVPRLAQAVLGRLWLCGHAPLHAERDTELRGRLRRYFPAAIAYGTRRRPSRREAADAAEALFYERYRSPAEDLRMVVRTYAGRLLDAFAGEPADPA